MIRKRDIVIREFESTDDLVIALVEMDAIASGYERYGIEVPTWLDMKRKEAKHELEARLRVGKERRLLEARMKREGLKTESEKRAALDAEIVLLEAELASK